MRDKNNLIEWEVKGLPLAGMSWVGIRFIDEMNNILKEVESDDE